MQALYLIDFATDSNSLGRVRAVREAMRALGIEARAKHADAKLIEVEQGGAALLGLSDDEDRLNEVIEALAAKGCTACIAPVPDPLPTRDEILYGEGDGQESPEDVFARREPEAEPETEVPTPEPKPEPVHPVFSVEAYETAIAMLASQQGDPIKAAAHACILGRTTGNTDLYVAAINALIVVFPWIGPVLVDNNLIDPVEVE